MCITFSSVIHLTDNPINDQNTQNKTYFNLILMIKLTRNLGRWLPEDGCAEERECLTATTSERGRI